MTTEASVLPRPTQHVKQYDTLQVSDFSELVLNHDVLMKMENDSAFAYVAEIEEAFVDFFSQALSDHDKLKAAQMLAAITWDESVHTVLGKQETAPFVRKNLDTLWAMHLQSEDENSPYKDLFFECVTEYACIPYVQEADLIKAGYLNVANKSGNDLDDQLSVIEKFVQNKDAGTKAKYENAILSYADTVKQKLVASMDDIKSFNPAGWEDYGRLAASVQRLG